MPDFDTDAIEHEVEDPTKMSDFVPNIDEVKRSLEHIRMLRGATLGSEIEPLDPEFIHRIRNPPSGLLELTPDDRLSIDLYLAMNNASEKTYDDVRKAIIRRFPGTLILSHYQVKMRLDEITGVMPIMRDMCVNSCLSFTGPFAHLQACPVCNQDRFNVLDCAPRQRHMTLPISTQMQALFRSPSSADAMQYRRQYTAQIHNELVNNDWTKTSPYRDIFDGLDYLQAVIDHDIEDNDIVLMLSIDGAQLYQHKASDCWIYIWVVMDLAPSERYKKKHILPGGFIPGPSKPKNLDSFLFTGLFHLAAVQKEGLSIWNALTGDYFVSKLFFILATADAPGMAYLNGRVGHHGRIHCRFQCPIVGRHKPGAGHYYPARFKPLNYAVPGCDHPDVDIRRDLYSFTSKLAKVSYRTSLRLLMDSQNKAQFDRNRLETGICKPTILLGLPPTCMLEVPACFGGDSMHLTALNIPQLLLSLWRGTIAVDPADNQNSWTWMKLKPTNVWQQHGREVGASKSYIPSSFDRCPRNPVEKINSGYKAWEYLLYIFGLGPCLFSNILPIEFWQNYCKLVRGVRLLLQEEISLPELKEAELMIAQFSDEFEMLYVQRRVDRLHFVRACIHTLSHMAPETVRLGPCLIYSQWALERTIGNLGEEIRLHSNAFANLAQRGLRRSQVNALKSMLPDLDTTDIILPRGALDIGDGYIMLTATEATPSSVRQCEAIALQEYLAAVGLAIDTANFYKVNRWARIRLPNRQVARSLWKEAKIPAERVQAARNVKVSQHALLYELTSLMPILS